MPAAPANRQMYKFGARNTRGHAAYRKPSSKRRSNLPYVGALGLSIQRERPVAVEEAERVAERVGRQQPQAADDVVRERRRGSWWRGTGSGCGRSSRSSAPGATSPASARARRRPPPRPSRRCRRTRSDTSSGWSLRGLLAVVGRAKANDDALPFDRHVDRHAPRGTDAGLDAGLPAHAAALLRPRRAICSRRRRSSPRPPTGRERTTYGEWAERTRRLGGVLDDLGISDDGRVATFGWNTARHLELYFAAPCTGRVLHTLNIRLFPEQLTYIVNHAEDEVIFVDRSLLGLLWPLVDTFETVRHFVVMDDGKGDVPVTRRRPARSTTTRTCSARPIPSSSHVDDENRAASMCYTSGTTGNPKGVVYSHRSTFLHTMGAMTADGLGAPRERRDPAGRADVPRQRLGPRPRRRRLRRHARDARPGPVGASDRRRSSRRRRSPSPPACRRSGWACCPS